MEDRTYVMSEVVGVSDQSIEHAIRNAVTRASQTLRALAWFEVQSVRGTIENGQVSQYQVVLTVAFRYLSDEEMRAWAQG